MKTVVVVLCCAVLAGCVDREQVQRPPADPTKRPPSHVSYNVKVVFTDSSRTKAILQSTEARVLDDRQETHLRDTVIVEFFSMASGRRVALLTADSAVIDDRTKDMTAFGDVRVWSDSSRTSLTTTSLLWDHRRQRISSTAFVRIVAPSETIEGVGFESDQYLTSYRIYRVRGERR